MYGYYNPHFGASPDPEHVNIGCTSSQRDAAFHLLQHPYNIPHGPIRQELQQIKHSNDQNPHKVSFNPYADRHTNTYDPRAQRVIDKAKSKYG